MIAVNSYSSTASDYVTENKGDAGQTFVIHVGTVAYEVIDDVYSDLYYDWMIVNRSTPTVWYDFDSVVSTGAVGQTVSPNGYVTGANPSLKPDEGISSNGRVFDSVYMKSNDALGCDIEVTIFKRD